MTCTLSMKRERKVRVLGKILGVGHHRLGQPPSKIVAGKDDLVHDAVEPAPWAAAGHSDR